MFTRAAGITRQLAKKKAFAFRPKKSLFKALQSNQSGIGGFGGYVRTNVSTEISVSVTIGGMKLLSVLYVE
jgi:hypothetical protein